MKKLLPTLVLAFLTLASLSNAQQTIFDDTWADGGADNGADAMDVAWYTSTSGSALEVGTGFLGLVTGGSGRGIHTVFNPITLGVGESLEVVATFSTPDTVGTDRSTGLRFGFLNSNGASLAADFTSSTDLVWDGLTGYMVDYDVNTGEENITFRERLPGNGARDRLLSTTDNFEGIGDSGGSLYTFTDNTTYTVSYKVTRTGEEELTFMSSLMVGQNLLSNHTEVDSTGIEPGFDLLGLHANSNTFGTSNTPDTPDNGIDFQQITLTYTSTGTTWRGYPVVDNVYVNTMGFLGWLEISLDPWVYSYSFENYLFLPDETTTEGWVFIPVF